MTQPRKTQHNYHFLVPPAQGWQAADSHRLSGQHMSKTRRKGNGIVTRLCQEKDTRAARSRNGTRCIAARTASRRCAIALQVQPTVLRGGVSWLANQQHGGGCRRERTSEQLFIRAAKIFRASAWSCGRSGLTTRSRALHSAPNAQSGTRVSSLTASGSQTPGRPSPCMPRSLVETDANHTASQAESLEATARALPLLQGPSHARARDRGSYVAAVSGWSHLHGQHRCGLPALQSCKGQHVAYRILQANRSPERADRRSDSGRHDLGHPLDLEAHPSRLRQHSTARLLSAVRQFHSALEPARVADTAAAPGLTDPPVAAAGNFCGGRAVAARLAHNQEVEGSSPFPATIFDRRAA